MPDGSTTSLTGSPVINALPATQPFSLSDPSTYATIIPTFTGGLQQIGSDIYGTVSGVASSVYEEATTVVDPLIKEFNDVETGAASAISTGANYVTTKVGNAVNGVVSATGSVFSFITKPVEWAIFAVVVIAGIYLLGPFVLAARR
jgi:phage-related protein